MYETFKLQKSHPFKSKFDYAVLTKRGMAIAYCFNKKEADLVTDALNSTQKPRKITKLDNMTTLGLSELPYGSGRLAAILDDLESKVNELIDVVNEG